jgi:hypothetical protein
MYMYLFVDVLCSTGQHIRSEHLSMLAAEIDALTKEIEEYKIIRSIPGIGE